MEITHIKENCKLAFFSLLLVSFLFSGCDEINKKSPSGFSDDPFSTELKAILKPAKTKKTISDYLRQTYDSDGYQPIWVKEHYRPTPASEKLIAELEEVKWDGFDLDEYNIGSLKLLKEKLDTTAKNSITDAIAFDTALTHCYLVASRYLLLGKITPKSVDSLWYHVNDTTWNAPELLVNAKDKYPSLDDFRSRVPTYDLLRNEYKHYYTLAADSAFLQLQSSIHYVKHPEKEMRENIYSVIKAKIPWLQTEPNDSMTEDEQLIIAYQKYAGLRSTGKLDSSTIADLAMQPSVYLQKLEANMERIRWMQQEFGSLYIIVDIPLMELFLRKDGTNMMHMNVVVGKEERQTPSLFARMANVVINPQWGVPPTILKNDVVPGFQKSGLKYLKKKGLHAYDRHGKMISSSSLNMKNLKRYTYKQAPGDDNSLGYVKFNLPNPWDIYLHDTPHRNDFEKRNRALSSGCIRLQHPQEMAVFILSQLEERKNFTSGRLDTIIETHKTRWEILKNKIPVHITYLTAFDDSTGKHIQFARDIYNRDEKLISVLTHL